MRIGDRHYRSIWMTDDPGVVRIIDQRKLPFEFSTLDLQTAGDTSAAISDMAVRGAPLIGVTAGFGLYLAAYRSRAASWCTP